MITLTTEQAQQIEEALAFAASHSEYLADDLILYGEALATIRAARAQEQAEQRSDSERMEPVGRWNWNKAKFEWLTKFDYHKHHMTPLYAAPQPVKQEPLMDYERINALRDGEQNGAEDAYFFVRPENDTPSLRKMFCQGFERGFHKGLKYAAPVRTKDLSDYEIAATIGCSAGDIAKIADARAVIAADREKNKC